jgi:hypothetical protein
MAKRNERLLEQVWTTNGTYTDPTPRHAEGRAALSALIDQLLRPLPGAYLRCSRAQRDGNAVLFSWIALRPDGRELARGTDFGEFAPDGRIQRIVGFAGAAPSVTP